MKLDIAKQWTAALRSGEYLQGDGALRKGDDTYCCLGVLCALAAKEGVVEFSAPDDQHRHYFVVGDEGYNHTAYLPRVVQEWAGLNDTDGSRVDYDYFWTTQGQQPTLASANDAGVDFLEIADLIDKYADEL